MDSIVDFKRKYYIEDCATIDPIRNFNDYYVDVDSTSSTEDGSLNQPFKTIQACLDAIGVPVDKADAKRKINIYIESGSYDENISTPIQRMLTFFCKGTVVLGDGASDLYNSTTPRNLVVNNTATGEPVGAPSRTIFAIRGASGETSSTHSAYSTGNMIISGDLSWHQDDGNTTSHESLLQGVKVQGDVTTNAFELGSVHNVQIDKCFFDHTFNAANVNLNVIRSTEFDNLITVNSVGRFVECEIAGGLTASVNNYYPPNGFFNCIVSGGTWTISNVLVDSFTREQIIDNSIVFVGSYLVTGNIAYLDAVNVFDNNIKIAGSATRSTTEGTNHLDIFDGTAPSGTLANGISLYSTSGELRVMDAAGNATLLSPHENETNNWIYDSVDTTTGKRLIIDMELMMKALNEKFGWDFVKEFLCK